MKIYTVDFKFISNENDMWELIRTSFELPEWFGKNLDALWDVLTGYIETPCKIYLLNCDRAPSDELNEIIEVIKEARKQYGEIELELRR